MYELYHHGVKGQRWGIRRYQNKDGTLTPAGKKRKASNLYDEAKNMSNEDLGKNIRRMKMEKQYSDMMKKRSTVPGINSSLEDYINVSAKANKLYKNIAGDKNPYANITKNTINSISNATRLTKRIAKMIPNKTQSISMSDQELQKAIDRLNLEQQYINLKSTNISAGRSYVTDILYVAGDLLAFASSSAGLIKSIKKIL